MQIFASFQGAEALLGFLGEGVQRRGEQVAEGLLVGTTDTSTQLVQVAETVTVCVVDDDGVGIRDVQT